ncbi:MAG: aminomethyl transferase family protein, partial [Litoreibacter sp.]|nr:aminomethyl transferase family protein [Litoreibacter sp.]
LRLFGARAVDSMRLEKGYLHWKSDILTEFDPFETGLGRFVELEKNEFVGKEALQECHAAGPRKRLVALRVEGDFAPAIGGASVMRGGRVVGTVTSGDWGHRTGLNLALAFVDPDLALEGSEHEIDIIGQRVPARVIPPCPYDPNYANIRG